MDQPRSPFGRSAVSWDPASSHIVSRRLKLGDGLERFQRLALDDRSRG